MTTITSLTVNAQEAILAEAQVYGLDPGDISDGYHTFNELYEHRCMLYILLAKAIEALTPHSKDIVWRSKTHSDGSRWDGWFLLGINKEPGKQITYHLPIALWDDCRFAEELAQAPPFDGHTPKDVLKRLSKINLF